MGRILVIEDDQDSCESLRRFLSASGYHVTCEADGRSALKTLLKTDPDLIVLDLKLPTMDGLAFLGVVRSYIRFRSHPVMVVTGVDDDYTLGQVRDMGVKHIFRKGHFEFADIRKAIEAELPI